MVKIRCCETATDIPFLLQIGLGLYMASSFKAMKSAAWQLQANPSERLYTSDICKLIEISENILDI